MNLRLLASLAALSVVALGCSSPPAENNTVADTAVEEDTEPVADSGAADTSKGDSAAIDSGSPDTTVGDAPAVDGDATSSDAADVMPDVPATCSEVGATESGDCGKCGKRARLCNSDGTWLPWGACTGESGSCLPAEKRTTDCGKCGKRTETCSSTCGWEPGACTGEGYCNAGDMEIQYGACSNPKYVKTRTCSATCAWGEWSTCSPPKGWNDITTPTITGRYDHTAVWTGTGGEMIVWGGRGSSSYYADGAVYNLSSDTWRTITAPSTFIGRYYHTAVWTGSKMIVWGGTYSSSSQRSDGVMYNPSADTWTLLPTPPSAFGARDRHVAVWTGTEMIVWGGYLYSSTYRNDGAAYNPSTNAWRTIAAAPIAGRYSAAAVWTGTKMIVYGGYGSSCSGSYCADAAAYDPVADSWTVLSPPSTDLDGRYGALGLATGSTAGNATFWGGYGSYVSSYYQRNTGATFDPTAGSWTAIAVPSETVFPYSRRYLAAGWSTGDAFYVWGGSAAGSSYAANGASYDFATKTWRAISDTNAPTGRYSATAVWTGAEAIVWGGYGASPYYMNNGKIYRP
ncbi:MAG: hypothetical protein HYV09_09635 [Deltaproteobacteria bacterium]|nr:hypothetical protein [Deltaproteobacteria bacterium]